MKVAIDIGGDSGHAIRGIGVHTQELLKAFEEVSTNRIEVAGVDFSKTDLSKYDLVHYPYFHPYFLTLPSKKPAKKVVVTIHDLIPLIYPKHYPPGVKGRLRFLEQKRRLRNVDAIITISETSKKDICRFLKVSPDKVHVVYLAPKKIFRELGKGSWKTQTQRRYKLPSRFVLYVGDVNYNKNIITFVRACYLARVPLVIVGKNALNIEKLAKSGHTEHRHLTDLVIKEPELVKRLGFVPDEDLAKIYNLATIYCQPSYYEGFGLPLLEAMAVGCPVIASKIQAHVEIAESAALFFDPNDPKELAEKLKILLSGDKTLRNQLVETGKVLVKNFTWEGTALGTIDVYQKVLST